MKLNDLKANSFFRYNGDVYYKVITAEEYELLRYKYVYYKVNPRDNGEPIFLSSDIEVFYLPTPDFKINFNELKPNSEFLINGLLHKKLDFIVQTPSGIKFNSINLASVALEYINDYTEVELEPPF